MAENTKIEWCDHTFNPWEGCTKVSPGCANCYAETRNHRYGLDNWGKGKPRRRTSEANWRKPVQWNKTVICNHCKTSTLIRDTYCCGCSVRVGHGEHPAVRRPRVFCASLADWLDDEVPIEWLADLLKLIHDTPNLDWLLLTKGLENWRGRTERVWQYWGTFDDGREWPQGEVALWLAKWLRGGLPSSVWMGTTVESQEQADKRIPELLKIPAKVRFLSCEPLLGNLEIEEYLEDLCDGGYVLGSNPIHWVICGGESGPNARPMHPDWARSLRDQCQAAGVPFFFKQWGEWAPFDKDKDPTMRKVGKKAAGRILDGREWSEFPSI